MSYEAYRANKIESGLLYQDFVVDLLLQTMGLAVVQYASKFYQMQVGESRTGVEIKHDEKYAATGNLWIEVAEKARPRAGDYAPSGIDRDDNTWLYVIGNYDIVFGFSKTLLRGLKTRYRILENNTKTSKGFLFPGDHATKYAAFIVAPHAETKVVKAIRDLQQLGAELHKIVCSNPAQASLLSALDLPPLE